MLIKPTKIQHDLHKAECDSVKLRSKENPYELYVMFENHSFLYFSLWPFSPGHLKTGTALLSGIAFSCHMERNIAIFQSWNLSNENLLYSKYPID